MTVPSVSPVAAVADADANLHDHALKYLAGGVSILPIDWNTKKPKFDLLPKNNGKRTWEPFYKKPATVDMVNLWFRKGIKAVAGVGGEVSGGLVVIDFDEAPFYAAWKVLVGSLANSLPVQKTGREGGGFQVWFRCPEPGKNTKLAWVPDDKDETGRKCAIETKAEGGYCVMPGSLHPSGRRYEALRGDFTDIPAVPQAVADALLAAARKLDECPLTVKDMESRQKKAETSEKHRSQSNGQMSVIDEYDRRVSIETELESRGYVQGGDRWKRPGGKSLSVYIEGGQSFHHSSNDPLNDGYWHGPFDVFCQFEHGGDCRAAVKAAAEHLGIPMKLADHGNGKGAKSKSQSAALKTLEPGMRVRVGDRDNFGTIVADNGDTCTVHFVSPEGNEAEKNFPKSQLASEDGQPLDGTAVEIPPPVPLRELVSTYPALRPAVIDGLLRVGETANIVATPKRGKSWLVNSLALSVAAGSKWLDTFQCTPGRVLIVDAELHPEVIAYRLPIVAEAMYHPQEIFDKIDILPLRGQGIDLLQLGPGLDAIEPNCYALIILDAWYRFLPVGFSENDNAQVMALYNKIDAYASRLGAAWVNVHHASKGDQSGKSTTDVGSGAGSQSRAADTHLIIRQHEQEDLAVIEAVVRSWPPVKPIVIKWNFPMWELDAEADPRKLWGARQSRDRASSETKDIHLHQDRQGIVNAMVANPELQTQTEIRNSARIGNPRFNFAWASLLADRTISPSGQVTKGNNRKYESFTLSHKEGEL